jgi:putative acetyltransferase
MKISIERADAPGVLELLELSDAFHAALYPPEGNYLLDVSELLQPRVTVVVARIDGRAVGMGALVEKFDYAEIKRMFVRNDTRGSGTADGILRLLEATAREHGVQTLQLETGPLQPAAIGFYVRHGFTRTANFGDYVSSKYSVCFAKQLL